jgi:hypothetical protein
LGLEIWGSIMNTEENLDYVINVLYDVIKIENELDYQLIQDIYYSINLLNEVKNENDRNTRPGIY